ncbi:hypothetical protein BC833DRAFT_566731, partial [Globomyces pollinis-pini]
VQDFKSKLWNAFSTHLQKAAIMEPDNITFSDEEPTVDDIDKYVSFKRHNRFMKPSGLTTLILHTIISANKPLVTSIFKHSESLSSKDHFIRYNRTILMPEIQDRSGAAADELICEIIEKLREAHQHNYVSAAAHWRIWASHIVSKPIPTHERLIMSPPPSHIIGKSRGRLAGSKNKNSTTRKVSGVNVRVRIHHNRWANI